VIGLARGDSPWTTSHRSAIPSMTDALVLCRDTHEGGMLFVTSGKAPDVRGPFVLWKEAQSASGVVTARVSSSAALNGGVSERAASRIRRAGEPLRGVGIHRLVDEFPRCSDQFVRIASSHVLRLSVVAQGRRSRGRRGMWP